MPDIRVWTTRFIPRTNDPWRNLKLERSWGGVYIVSPTIRKPRHTKGASHGQDSRHAHPARARQQ